MSWLVQNLGTIVVCLILAGIVAAAVRHLVRQKRSGSACAGCSSCGSCPHCSSGGCRGETGAKLKKQG